MPPKLCYKLCSKEGRHRLAVADPMKSIKVIKPIKESTAQHRRQMQRTRCCSPVSTRPATLLASRLRLTGWKLSRCIIAHGLHRCGHDRHSHQPCWQQHKPNSSAHRRSQRRATPIWTAHNGLGGRSSHYPAVIEDALWPLQVKFGTIPTSTISTIGQRSVRNAAGSKL